MDNSQDLVFGFLPATVLQNINEVGNWKTRSNAIEQVQQGLASLSPVQTQVLLQQLPEFSAFVLQLLADHNFKVVIAGLSVLADAARSLRQALHQHMGDLAPVLVNRLTDHRAPVAAAALKAATSVMQHVQPSNPAAFVNRLLQLYEQQESTGPAQDLSALLQLIILAMLKCPVSSLALPTPARALLKGMQQPSSNGSSSIQQALAMEALALATDSLGAQLPNLLKQAGGTDLKVTQVLMQVQQLQRPVLAADGSIQHNSTVQAAMAAAEASTSASSGFRIGSGLYDRTSNNSASSLKSDSSTGLAWLKPTAVASSNSKGGAESGLISADVAGDPLNSPLGSGSWNQAQQQTLPPGSLGALAAHARLISQASDSLAAAAAATAAANASNSQGGSRPVSGFMLGVVPPNGQAQEGRYSNKLQLSLSSSSLGADQPYTAGRSPLGSPRAQPDTSGMSTGHGFSLLQRSGDWAGRSESPVSPHWQTNTSQQHTSSTSFRGSDSSTLTGSGHQLSSRTQPQQSLQSQLSKLQLYDSSKYAPIRQDSQQQDDTAPAAAASRTQQHQPDSSSANWPANSLGQMQTGLQAAPMNAPVPNLRYQQAAGSGSSSSVMPRRSTADQVHGGAIDAVTNSHYADTAAAAAAAATAANGSSSTWLTAAGSGWASADGSGSDAGAIPYSSGRPETLSPSRGERLAQLKRRQVEKRAVSATGSTRCSTPGDSQDDGALASATAAAMAGTSTSADAGPLRACTAGPTAHGTGLNWRLNASSESPRGSGYSPSGTLSLGEDGSSAFAPGSSSGKGGHGSLLQWHIPTGPGGRVMSPGSPSAAQQQQQAVGSLEPIAGAFRAPGRTYSPSSSYEDSSSLPIGRVARSSSGSPAVTGQPPSAGQMLQYSSRSTSAAAVLVNAAGEACANSSSCTECSSAGASSSAGYRSSRFLQARSGSSSPAPEGGVQPSSAPLGSSRMQGGQGLGPTSTASAGFTRPPQQPQPQLQSMGARAQTAAAAVGGAAGAYSSVQAAGEWGTGASNSPVGRFGSSCGPNSSGCFSGGSSGAGGAGSNWPSSAGAATSPTRSPGRVGTGLRGAAGIGERPQSSSIAEVDLAGADLAPLVDPETGLRQAVSKMQTANAATRKEINWQAQLDALVDARRLIAHHTEVLRPSARELILAALPAVDELRSTTSRMALLFFQELPSSGVSFERGLDEVAPVLLKKAGDLSTAGRDKFLAREAAKALSAVCSAVSESRAFSALIAAGAGHKSPHVRSRTAAQLDEVAAGGAGVEALLRSGNWAVLDKLFKTAAGFLQEGSLDTRTYGKRLLWAVKAAVRGNRSDMDRLVSGISPEGVQRRVVEVLEGLSAPPPPPVNRGSTGPRATPGSASGCSTPTGGVQPAAPFSAPPASMFTAAGMAAAAAGVQDGPHSVGRAGYSSAGSTSGGSSGPARRALFNHGSGNASGGLHVQGAAAAGAVGSAAAVSPGSPGSPTLAASSSGRRRSTAALVDSSRRTPGSPSASGGGSPAGVGPSGGAFSAVGSTSGSDRRLSGGCPPGPPGPMSPELQEAVNQVGLQLGSKVWRNRMDALRALSALGPALPEVPNAALEGLLQALVGRLNDGNAKVNQKALEVLCEVAYTVNLRTLLIMPSLMPALTANLGSTNDKLRSCASTALDTVAAVVAPQPQLLIQGFAQAVANGSVRTKVAVVEKMGTLLPGLHQAQPQLTRLLLPAAFSLVMEARGEAKPAAAQLINLLLALLGSTAVLNAAANVSSAAEQRVRQLAFGVAAC